MGTIGRTGRCIRRKTMRAITALLVVALTLAACDDSSPAPSPTAPPPTIPPVITRIVTPGPRKHPCPRRRPLTTCRAKAAGTCALTSPSVAAA